MSSPASHPTEADFIGSFAATSFELKHLSPAQIAVRIVFACGDHGWLFGARAECKWLRGTRICTGAYACLTLPVFSTLSDGLQFDLLPGRALAVRAGPWCGRSVREWNRWLQR
jgi:hypothetical protein